MAKKLSKLPSQYNTEDLLAALDKIDGRKSEPTQPIESETLEYKNDILPFLGFYGLQAGAYPVYKKLIYTLYRQWSKEPVNERTFSLEANKYIFLKQLGKREYYYINQSSLKISEKSFKLLKKQTQDVTKSPRYTTHFNNFLKQHDIKSGNLYIPFYGIYYLYDIWCFKINRKKKMGYRNLFNFCTLNFKQKRIDDSRGIAFALNKNIKKHLNEKQLEEIRKARENEKKANKKTKK